MIFRGYSSKIISNINIIDSINFKIITLTILSNNFGTIRYFYSYVIITTGNSVFTGNSQSTIKLLFAIVLITPLVGGPDITKDTLLIGI